MANLMNGKVCLVTGASQGLGRHFAQILATSGATVVATSLKSEMDKLENLVHEIIEKGGKAIAIDIDVTDYGSFNDKVTAVTKHTGQINVLVNVDKKITGSIINIGSIAGFQSKKYALPFCISKAGMN